MTIIKGMLSEEKPDTKEQTCCYSIYIKFNVGKVNL